MLNSLMMVDSLMSVARFTDADRHALTTIVSGIPLRLLRARRLFWFRRSRGPNIERHFVLGELAKVSLGVKPPELYR